MERFRHLLVLTGPSGRTLAVVALESGGYAVDDLDDERRLGQASADFNSFLVAVDGSPHIAFAGPAERRAHAITVIKAPGDPLTAFTQTCRVKNGVWLSFPVPLTPGMQVTAIWQDKDERELWRLTTPPLRPDALGPMFGPSWTTYAPLDET
jgi:hypothetical protein